MRGSVTSGTCSGSSPNLVASNWDTVDACQAVSVDGDTITVSPGSYNVSQTTIITKYVKIVPSGTVNLTDNVCSGSCDTSPSTTSLIYIVGNDVGNTQFGKITSPCNPVSAGCGGFNIVTGTSQHGYPSTTVYISDSGTKQVLIFGNTWLHASGNFSFDVGYPAKAIYAGNHMEADLSGGSCLNNFGFVKMQSDGSGWSQIAKFGSADTTGDYKIYVENNYCLNCEEGIDLSDGGREAFRFNTFVNSSITHHGSDTQTYGGRYSEVYNNSFSRDNSNFCGNSGDAQSNGWLGYRGGTSIVVQNVLNSSDSPYWGPKSAISLAVENIHRLNNAGSVPWKCWGTASNPSMFTGYPDPFQPGWGYVSGGTQFGNATLSGSPVNGDIQPFYFANNTGAANYDAPVAADYSPDECSSAQTSADYIVANREYYEQIALGSFDGTSGASQGPRASRPATCTAGVVYWSTDQGSWNTSSSGGQGVLDKCTATNTWTNAFYTPYTYPHPLQEAVIVTPTLVSASINVFGTILYLVYSTSVTFGAGGNSGVTVTASGGSVAATYASGSSSNTLAYALSRPITAIETAVTGYTQPGNGIEAVSGTADCASYSAQTVANGSALPAALRVTTLNVTNLIIG